jgi:two-component system, NarL family, sensor histidine kinase DegS
MSESHDTATIPTGPLEALIAELRQELEVTQSQRREIGLLVKQTAAELERLAPKVKDAASRVQRAHTSPDSYSRVEIQEVYEASQEAQLRQFMMKSQMEQLSSRVGHLQRAEELLGRLLAQATSAAESPSGWTPESRSAPDAAAAGEPMDAALMALELSLGRVSLHLQEDTAQKLSQLMLRSEVCERLLESDLERAKIELAELKQVASGALKATRGIIHELRPPALDEVGLATAARRFVDASHLRESAEVEVRIDGVERRLPKHVELGAFRIVQEALLNSARHSGAGRIDLALTFQPAQLVATVSDDGRGFDVNAALAEKGQMHLSGLAGMQRWARLIGATLSITSEPGSGSRVELTIPQ